MPSPFFFVHGALMAHSRTTTHNKMQLNGQGRAFGLIVRSAGNSDAEGTLFSYECAASAPSEYKASCFIYSIS